MMSRRSGVIEFRKKKEGRHKRHHHTDEEDYDYYMQCERFPSVKRRREIYISSDDDSVEIWEKRKITERKHHCRSRCRHKSQPRELCDAKYYTKEAIKHLDDGRVGKALNYINIALKLTHNNKLLSELYEMRGMCYSKLEKPRCSKKAFVDWERAFQLDPDNQNVRKNMSGVMFVGANRFFKMKLYRDAFITAEKALYLFKGNIRAAVLLEHLKEKSSGSHQNDYGKSFSNRERNKRRKVQKHNNNEDELHEEEINLNDAKHFTDLAMKEFDLSNFARALILINKALRMCPRDEQLMNKLHEMKQKIVLYMKEHKITAIPVESSESNKCESSARPDSLTPSMTIPEIMNNLQNSDPRVRYTAAVNARKFLSGEESPPIEMFITAGVIPHLVSNLIYSNNIHLQLEVCRTLSKITSGNSEQTRTVVEAGAIPFIINFISSPHTKLVEQAICILGDIIGNCPVLKELLINNGIVHPLLSVLTPHISTNLRRTVTWILSNLCESKSHKVLKECIPAFAVLICHSDPETVTDACCGISYLTQETETIKEVIDCGAVPRLVELLQKDVAFIKPVISVIGNIVRGEDSQTQVLIDAGVLIPLKKLITQDNITIVMDICWIISNICNGNTQQIQAVIDAGIMEHVIKVLNQGEFKCKEKAAWAVRNITVGGTVEQILYLFQVGVIAPVCNVLSLKDPDMLKVLLEILNNILNAAFKTGTIESACSYIEHCGGLNKIENLQMHQNTDIYKAAFGIINAYFSDEGEEMEVLESDNFQVAENSTFTFSAPTNC